MAATGDVVELSESEAACLDAVRRGHETKTAIAVEARRDLKTVDAVLKGLRRARLIGRGADGRWRATARGRGCSVRAVPNRRSRRGPRRSGEIVPGSATERLLEALDRPMRGAELVELLGVSTQRVHQIVVRLHALGLVRLADRAHVLHLVARADDPTVLLTRDEERVLSALPDDATTAWRLSAASGVPTERVGEALGGLIEAKLVEDAGTRRGRALVALSREGSGHPQRLAPARRAEPAPLVVKSDRVCEVLAHIADRGGARIVEVRNALRLPKASMNALMQYLKRKGLVRKVTGELHAPYQLTEEGQKVLGHMLRRAA